jgi:acyl-CoA dehydrogenase-like protein
VTDIAGHAQHQRPQQYPDEDWPDSRMPGGRCEAMHSNSKKRMMIGAQTCCLPFSNYGSPWRYPSRARQRDQRYTALRDPRIAPRQSGRLYCLSSSDLHASGVAGVALGIARGMIADFTELATQKFRVARASGSARNQVIQRIAEQDLGMRH